MHRFERGARATAALTSPYTVQLYDFGIPEDGRPYYVMELLDRFNPSTLVWQLGSMPPELTLQPLLARAAARL
jgi:serine/threonine-protein kinase